MQTATIYTLDAKVVPVESCSSTVRTFPLDEPTLTYGVVGGGPLRIPTSETIDLPLHHVGSFSKINFPGPLLNQSNKPHRQTQYHLFAVEPALKEILSAPFRAEWAAEVSKLEEDTLAYKNINCKLEEKLNDALSTNASLNDRYLSTNDKLFDIRCRVHNFCEYNVFRRLWVAFRNDLTP